MLWFLQEYPIISGLIYSIVLGLPVGLATVWGLREFDEPPKKTKTGGMTNGIYK